MSGVRLTKAQRALLFDIECCGMPVADHYEPAKKLVDKGFAAWREGEYLDHLCITPAGRSALNSSKGE